jgi:hypothetical protein
LRVTLLGLETYFSLELVALIPSAFVQVRAYVFIEKEGFNNKVSLKIYVSSGLMMLVPYASV